MIEARRAGGRLLSALLQSLSRTVQTLRFQSSASMRAGMSLGSDFAASMSARVTWANSRYSESRGLSTRLRSEEHTSELQSLMRISYAVFCLKKKKNKQS